MSCRSERHLCLEEPLLWEGDCFSSNRLEPGTQPLICRVIVVRGFGFKPPFTTTEAQGIYSKLGEMLLSLTVAGYV